MGNGQVFLEDSGGGRRNNPSEAQIAATVEQIGNSIDHCILHLPGDAFVQASGEPDRLFVEYGDSSGVYESARADLDALSVGRIFRAAAAGDDAWKSTYIFQQAGHAGGQHASAGGGFGRGAGMRSAETAQAEAGGTQFAGDHRQSGQRSAKDQLLGSVKREVTRQASRGIRNLVRKGIRTFKGRR